MNLPMKEHEDKLNVLVIQTRLCQNIYYMNWRKIRKNYKC